jgi:hypothetical protein
MKESPKVYLSLESKKLIVEALINHIDRWGIKVDDEPLNEDAKIEINRLVLDINRHYLRETGFKKYKYPLIPLKEEV